MRQFIKNCVLQILVFLARVRLRRLRLIIVGVTGSIGKTSTKDAIFTILHSRFPIQRSEKSYNTEFGMPLAILGQDSGFSSPWKWIKVMTGAVWNALVGGRDVHMLVAEMGVDKPGDMVQLLKLAQPVVGVMTNIRPVHLAEGQFKDLDDIFNEKKKLVESIPEKGFAILNADDPYILQLRDALKCKTIWYGSSEIADLRLLSAESTEDGLRITVSYKDQMAVVTLPLLGGFQAYVLLPAVAVALTQGFELQEALDALQKYQLPPGRMNPIAGVNGSLIIDSSYNASPEAVKEALGVLGSMGGRRIAVLGNMNELGAHTESLHRDVGRHIVGKTDMLLTVGEDAKKLGDEALAHGFDQQMYKHFENTQMVTEFLRTIISPKDAVLVKGSQNKVRLERLVKALMKHPEKADELLVRQGPEWDKID
jgi:UDP-N-acetylmuramyl pentapeptide synthase